MGEDESEESMDPAEKEMRAGEQSNKRESPDEGDSEVRPAQMPASSLTRTLAL